ncbi:MAG: hypothetical protein NT062_11135 [Proteobacteria bacterium]|nr:hypothetical protein [Pseudomonadota bacterium]
MAGAWTLKWNGKDLPIELQDVPPGQYIVETFDEVPGLSADENAACEALSSLCSGPGGRAVEIDQVQPIEAALPSMARLCIANRNLSGRLAELTLERERLFNIISRMQLAGEERSAKVRAERLSILRDRAHSPTPEE